MNSKKRSLDESDKKIIAFNQKWTCKKCKNMLPSTYEIDHIIPFSVSFDDSYDNLQALCPNCHRRKTQLENKRISKYKKLCSIRKNQLCWFCLKPNEKNHDCKKVCKKIKFVKKCKPKIHSLDSFIFTADNDYKVLSIKLTPDVIWVDNYFTDMEGKHDLYTVEKIARSVEIANRFLKQKYDKIEVTIDFLSFTEEEIPSDLVEHLDKYLPSEIKKIDVLKNEKNAEFTYVCID